jgi:hypothetical protein
VQHKPKICISEKPTAGGAPPPPDVYRLVFSFTATYNPPLPAPPETVTGSGNVTSPDHTFFDSGVDAGGNTWTFTAFWPADPTNGFVRVFSSTIGKTWEQNAQPGYFMGLPSTTMNNLFIETPFAGGGNYTMTQSLI